MKLNTDWDAMARLHEKGYISDPVGKTKSVAMTEQGLLESQRLFTLLFGDQQSESVQTQTARY